MLIHGATGGVGQFATQLARERGAHVIATVSSEDVERARALGADEVIDHTAERFEEVVEPVDLVFDTTGGDRLVRSPAVLRPGGRLVSVAEEPPRTTDDGDNAVYFVVEPNREQLAEISQLVDSGRLEVQVDQTFPSTMPAGRSSASRTEASAARWCSTCWAAEAPLQARLFHRHERDALDLVGAAGLECPLGDEAVVVLPDLFDL